MRLAAAVAITGTSTAIAETPAPVLSGAERVVIACESDASLSAAERAALCAQLVKKASMVTDLPVAIATEQDTNVITGDRAKQAKQLLLRVSVRADAAQQGRKALSLAVMPVRAVGGPVLAAPLKSRASLVKVQDRWVVQGPIDAFTKLLDAKRRKLRAPLHSDS